MKFGYNDEQRRWMEDLRDNLIFMDKTENRYSWKATDPLNILKSDWESLCYSLL